MVAGHLDTVPPNGNERARVEGEWCHGLGAVDMKSGLAVMLELARTVVCPAVDLTYVFYAGEEVDSRFNGLELLYSTRADLLDCDVAVLAEPTAGRVEAGCQGSLRVAFTGWGLRAHTARGWLGRNAVHRIAPVIEAVAGQGGREVTIDGCTYREGAQVVGVSGGVAGNVVPDAVTLTVNRRFAPDRDGDEVAHELTGALTAAWARGWTGQGTDPDRCEVEVLDLAPAARPSLHHPVLASLVRASGAPARAKLGWTDVARLASRGVPATNFGPGDPNLAHHPAEKVSRAELEACFSVLSSVLGATPVAAG